MNKRSLQTKMDRADTCHAPEEPPGGWVSQDNGRICLTDLYKGPSNVCA